MKQSLRWGLLLAVLCLPTAAMADPKDDARRHFAAGLQAAQDGDFEIALQRFLAAQEAYPHPATIYNIAQAYFDLNDLQNALAYYRLFREQSPEQSGVVDPVIAVLEARVGAPKTDPTTSASPVASTGPSLPSDGPARVIVTGPSDEEMARLEALATELEALMSAIKDRRAEDLAIAQQIADGDVPPVEETDEVIREETQEVLPSGGFLEGAYDKRVVTASRVGQDPLDSPSTLTVLTDEDIRMSGAQNVPDVLRRVVGLDVMMGTAGQYDISIRGFNRKAANKVLILIDGRSTYTDFVGVTLWSLLPIALEEIERIEVIRGPGSAVYGANAMTGVINIITKTPGETEQRLVRVDTGSPGLARGVVYTSGRVDETAYRFSASYQQHGAWEKPVDLQASPELAVVPFSDNPDQALQALRASGRIDQQFGSQGYARLEGGLTDADLSFINIGALPTYGMAARHNFLRGDVSWGDLHLRSFWNRESGTTGPWVQSLGQNQDLTQPLVNDAVDIELEGPLTFSTGSIDHTLSLGVGYRYKQVGFGSYLAGLTAVEHHQRAFINEQASVGKLGVVASLRIDNHPLIPLNETISPRSALLYRLFDKTSLRATFGTAFRAPNGLESYMDFNLPNPAADGVFIRDLGDSQTLSPERISTYELGIHDESTFFHTADLVVYMNQVRDLISLDAVTPGINFLDPEANGFEFGSTGWVNLPQTYTGTGIEAELEVYPTDGLDVYGNVDLQQIIETDENGETRRDQSVSGVKVNLGTMYRSPFRTDFTADMHYVGPQMWRLRGFGPTGEVVFEDTDLPARTIVSTRLASRPFQDERLELAATVWNLFGLTGSTFREHPDGERVSGRVFGSITYKF